MSHISALPSHLVPLDLKLNCRPNQTHSPLPPPPLPPPWFPPRSSGSDSAFPIPPQIQRSSESPGRRLLPLLPQHSAALAPAATISPALLSHHPQLCLHTVAKATTIWGPRGNFRVLAITYKTARNTLVCVLCNRIVKPQIRTYGHLLASTGHWFQDPTDTQMGRCSSLLCKIARSCRSSPILEIISR